MRVVLASEPFRGNGDTVADHNISSDFERSLGCREKIFLRPYWFAFHPLKIIGLQSIDGLKLQVFQYLQRIEQMRVFIPNSATHYGNN